MLLLDLVPEGAKDRNVLAARSIENLKKAKPPAFVDPAVAHHIAVGNFEDDLKSCGTAIGFSRRWRRILRSNVRCLPESLRTFAIMPS